MVETESNSIDTQKIHTGTVTGITSFGAFVKLEEGQEGLVHISEIADAYVKSINDFLDIGQQVQIKVIGTNKKGKLDLSIKRVEGYSLNPKKEAVSSDGPKEKKTSNHFEDKLNSFLKRSEEKQLDYRRNLQARQGIKKKKKKKK